MNNKRGWLRIIEASIAILIILTVLFALYKKQQTPTDIDLSERARSILDEVSQNSSLRDKALSNETADINSAISQHIPETNLAFEFQVCDLEDVCGKSTYTAGNVYTAERVISASISNPEFKPKKIRLFMWRR